VQTCLNLDIRKENVKILRLRYRQATSNKRRAKSIVIIADISRDVVIFNNEREM